MAVCEQHQDCKDTLKDHEHRIIELERNDIRDGLRIQCLIESLEKLGDRIDKLVEVGWKLVIGSCSSVLLLLAGFFLWYVQKLG